MDAVPLISSLSDYGHYVIQFCALSTDLHLVPSSIVVAAPRMSLRSLAPSSTWPFRKSQQRLGTWLGPLLEYQFER